MKRVALAAVVALGAFGLVMMRGPARDVSKPSATSGVVLAVPIATEAPLLDGAMHEGAWRDTDARSGAFVLGKDMARPHSDARFVRTADTLWIGLYASDQDVHGADLFRVTLGAKTTTVTARCAITPAGARAACDVDGTIDDPEEDEEWTVELAVPLAGLGERAPITIERCEAGEPDCGRFTATLALR